MSRQTTLVSDDGSYIAQYAHFNGIRSARHEANNMHRDIISATDSKIENLWENFLSGAARAIHHPEYLGRRTAEGSYEWMTFDKVQEYVNRIVNSLIMTGYNTQDKIGIFSVNTPEWVIVDLACFSGNFVSVPLYSAFDNEALVHILNQTEMRCMFASSDKADHIIKLGHEATPHLEMIVVMDDKVPASLEMNPSDSKSWVISGVPNTPKVISLTEFMDLSQMELPFHGRVARYDDVATICYTSGTTGMPKGVMLTHGNILAELAALSYAADNGRLFTPKCDDYHISYLPLAHVFERVMIIFMTSAGGKVGFYRGIMGSERERSAALMDDIATLKPTIFISVPRIYNRMYERVMETIEKKGGMTKMLFAHAMKKKLTNMKDKRRTTHAFWDKVIFAKIRASLGGRVRVLVTGSAPIDGKVIDFLRVAFSAEVYEGYGQTETTAGLTVTLKDEVESGNVGVPLPCCEVKLVDIPEMNYTSADVPHPRGQIYVRGNQVFKGYYKDAEKTTEAFTEDGWYKTGDVGMWDARGRLVVIDRLKCIFKLAQGEYVAPEKVETCLATFCDGIASIFVTGDSLHNYPVAIVVPNGGKVDEGRILEQIKEVGKEHGLKGFEIPQKVTVIDSFPEEVLTPTFKLKRNVARIYYTDLIHKMYA